MLIEKLLMNYNTDVRPVENASQVLEVTVGVQPYRLLRVVRLAYFCYFQMHFLQSVNRTIYAKEYLSAFTYEP